MKLSLCVICKNEEKKIARCMNSVKGIVDEMIIVDTGSEDRTVEIAKELGAKVFEITWEKDFAKAKNFAIEQATGDWIIFLDADEYFTKESASVLRGFIKEAIKRKKDCIYCDMLNEENGEVKSIFKTNRVFKNNPQIRYKGRVHERLCREKGDIKGVDFLDQIRIRHDGYSEEVWNAKNKGARNIELLLEELKERPTSSDICYYLMQAYSSTGKWNEAWEYGTKALQYNRFELMGAKVSLLNLSNALNKEETVVVSLYNKAIKEDNKYPDFDFRLGQYLYHRKKYNDSIKYFELCLKKVEMYQEIGESVTKGNPIQVLELMGNAYLIQRQYEQAIPILVKILRINPYRVKDLYNLISILQTNETGSNIGKVLGKLYDYSKVKDQLLMLQISKEVKNQELFEYVLQFADEAVKEQINA